MLTKNEKKKVMLRIFFKLVHKTKKAYTYLSFWEKAKPHLSNEIPSHICEQYFREMVKSGHIVLTHQKNQPTPMVFMKQKFIPRKVELEPNERSWLTLKEKQKHASNSKRYLSIGSFSTRNESFSLLEDYANDYFKTYHQPMTSKKLASFILLNNTSDVQTYQTILDALKCARSQSIFQNVYPSKPLSTEQYFIPKNIDIKELSNEWLTVKERSAIWSKEADEQQQSSQFEPDIYKDLLKMERYDVYLFAKLCRLTSFPKESLLTIKVADIFLDQKQMVVPITLNDQLFHTIFLLDEGTISILQSWLEKRKTYSTSNSPYLFITKRLEYMKHPDPLMNVFRKLAKTYGFFSNTQYREWGTPYWRQDFIEQKVIRLTRELDHPTLSWFKDIEKMS